MAFDLDEINKDLLGQWNGDDYYLLKYFPRRYGRDNQTTNLILRFKEDDLDAVAAVIYLLNIALENMEKLLRDTRRARYIVSIPSSTAGKANVPSERVCNLLAAEFDWLIHIPNALVRVESVQKSAFAPPGQRPDYEDHLRTIQYQGPAFRLTDESIIMLDDVITRGETSAACRDILRSATGCQRVLGVYVGRTQ